MKSSLRNLQNELEGELHTDSLSKAIYATDASVYRELPIGVAYPKNIKDLKKIIHFCTQNRIGVIPRAAGTSLAGQCVGKGIVVDISKYFTEILDFNQAEQTVVVQPGVIRDDLNRQIKSTNLFLGPNTSTSNRAMIGGMVGNNSSGTTSIKYGVTRDKVIELQAILSDGSQVVFKEIGVEEFRKKMSLKTLEGNIYRTIFQQLSSKEAQKTIIQNFPKPEIHRRNTGYAIDKLIESQIFYSSDKKFNMCDLLCGSEGTLAFITQIKLKLDPLPPENRVMVAAHFSDISTCLNAVEPVMQHDLYTCEMMDKTILDCTKNNLKYVKNRFFIQGDPKAILMLEICHEDEEKLQDQLNKLLKTLEENTESYSNALISGPEIELVLDLRKAGLGLLGNMVGDKKTVACIEDTAVALQDLANYITDFTKLMDKHQQPAVYYAHAGAGELHLRPILNLKKSSDVKLFKQITSEVAELVKKYRGSLSGEHGDGRVRAEFIEVMIGSENLRILKKIKQAFDPLNIFNPGKIVQAPPMENFLRYKPDRKEPEIKTLMDFSDTMGILRHAEQCNGSGDCRKSVASGGTMCPSYRATRNEKDTTRARANALREFLTQSEKPNRFDHQELKEVFDLCISCKACHSECPSNVDAATLKAEFEYQYQKENGSSLRAKLFAYNNTLNGLISAIPFSNYFMEKEWFSKEIKKFLHLAPERSLPKITRNSLVRQINRNGIVVQPKNPIKSVYLFVDEFTNYLEPEIGLDAIKLLIKLNYEVKFVKHKESGRAYISKGFLKQAQKLARENISIFDELISEESPLIGIEPSSILSFRDEYLRLAENRETAVSLAKNCLMIEEFIQKEIQKGNISSSQFTQESRNIKLHGHCHQKALSGIMPTYDMLNLPQNYSVRIIPSGCCGMAGSFGYEEEHYEVSMKIGNQTLFPAIRKTPEETILVANGTSCRHQIKDGTQRVVWHPVSVLWQALN